MKWKKDSGPKEQGIKAPLFFTLNIMNVLWMSLRHFLFVCLFFGYLQFLSLVNIWWFLYLSEFLISVWAELLSESVPAKFISNSSLFVNTLGSIHFKLKCIPTLDAILPQIHKAKSVQSPSPKSALGWEPNPVLPIKIVVLPFCEEQKNLGSAIKGKAS